MTEVVSQAASICSLILSIVAVAGLIVTAVKRAKAPNELQNERITELEKKVTRHDELFLNDLRRFENMEAGNRIMQKCMLSLLSHGIDGNDIDGMRQARSELQEYLINH